MDQKTSKIFFALIRSSVCSNFLSDEEKLLYCTEMLPKMVETAKQHDILHLLVFGLKINNLLGGENKELEKAIFLASYRYEQMNFELVQLCEALEKEKIPFIPLKGSVICQHYPEV